MAGDRGPRSGAIGVSTPPRRFHTRPALAGLAGLLALASAVAPPARAADPPLRTFFVDGGGDDAADGSVARPWRTLQRAAAAVRAGDLVIVRAGRYAGFDLRADGTAVDPIVFRAEPGTVVDVPNPVTPMHGINLEGADHVLIEGFTVTGMPRAGIRSVVNHHVTIRNNVTDGNGRWGIFSGFSADLTIEGNVAARSQLEHGIYVSNSGDRPIIRGNHVWGNYGNGIHMNGDLSQGGDGIISSALVEGNVIHDNGRGGGSGINGDGVQDSRILNNLLYENHASGISLYRIDGAEGSRDNLVAYNTIVQAVDGRWAINIKSGSTGTTLVHNILLNQHPWRGSINILGDSLPGFVSEGNVVMERFSLDDGDTVLDLAEWRSATGQDLHSLVATAAALFAAPGADYHLRPDAPARDAGTTVPGVARDLEGTPRPVGPAPDIGAYESAESPGAPDLAVAAAAEPAASVHVGGTLTLADRAANLGTAGAPPSTTRYYLSLDPVRNRPDRRLRGRRPVPALAPGEESGGTVTVRVPAGTVPALYFVLACVDDRKAATESDETNNCAASTARVTVIP
jgi:hypothetical protein